MHVEPLAIIVFLFSIQSIEAGVDADTTNAARMVDTIPSIPMTTSRVIQSNVISSAGPAITLDDEDDDFLKDIDMDVITSATAQHPVAPAPIAPPHQNARRHSTLLFDDIDDYDFSSIDPTIEQSNANAQPNANAADATTSQQSAENVPLNTSADATLPIYDEKYRFKIRGINLASVRQLQECGRQHLVRRKHFLVRATIDDIVQKARVSRGKWVLGVTLTDPVSQHRTVETTVHPTVTEKLAGKSGREVQQLFNERSEKPQNQQEISDILENLSTQLEMLNAFLKLEYTSDAQHPTLVEIINAAPVLERKLQEKIAYEQL